jgi:Integrase core domain
MELSTRRVHVVGITPHPTDAFMTPCARQLTDPVDGLLLSTRYLLHDRDEKFRHGFDRTLRASGVEPIVLPPRSPTLNAHCERFVRSIKEEALNQMIMVGEAALRYVIPSYLTYYHHERNHQGLGNQDNSTADGTGGNAGEGRYEQTQREGNEKPDQAARHGRLPRSQTCGGILRATCQGRKTTFATWTYRTEAAIRPHVGIMSESSACTPQHSSS